MKDNFNRAFEITVGLEGGYTNDPDDPGGETKYGISKRYNPDVDIKNLTLEQAKDIYKNYWNVALCDELKYPIDIVTFDRAVLYGPADAKKWGQDADTWEDVLFDSLQHVVDHWNPKYAKGWINRILELRYIFNEWVGVT